jgi:hypothetical protein
VTRATQDLDLFLDPAPENKSMRDKDRSDVIRLRERHGIEDL